MEQTSYAPGTPSWIDLGSPDIDGSAAFYSALFGWECEAAGPEEETGGYRMFFYKGKPVAGLGPAQNPGPPYWTTYVTIADADETIAKVKAAGGTVFVEPMDVLDVGRMAVFADPTGAALAIWQPRAHIGAGIVNEPNTLCWNELSTRDLATAMAFYAAVFGWAADTMGDADHQYTEWQLGGQSIGGMMETPPMVPAEVPPHWMVYFAVDDADDAVARITELGGSVMTGPVDIEPGRFAVAADPQGAVFSVLRLKADLGG